MIRILFFIQIIFVSFPNFAHSTDSLQLALDSSRGETRVSILLKLSNEYREIDLEKSVDFALQALNEVKSRNSDELRYRCNIEVAKSYLALGNYALAIDFAETALSQAKNPNELADANYLLGNIQDFLSEYEQALTYHLKALEIRQELKNTKDLVESYNALAFVYRGMGLYEKAIDILDENYLASQQIGDGMGMRRAKFNTGLMTLEMNRHAEAIPIFRMAVSGLAESDEPRLFGRYYNNLANCFEKQLHVDPRYYDSALYYGKKNLIIKERLNDQRGIANAHNGLAATYERSSDYERSGYHSAEALRMADSLDYKPNRRNALSYLVTAQLGLSDMEETNDHFVDYINTVEEINRLSASRTLTELAAKYETEKNLTENRLLKSNIEQQNRITMLLITLAVVLFLLIIAFGVLYRIRLRASKRLERDKDLIARQSHELQKLNDQKSKFFASISHGLRTPLALINGHTDDVLLKKKLPIEAEESLRKVKYGVRQLSLMVNDLLDLSKIDLSEKHLYPKPIAIDALLRRIVAAFTSMAETKNIDLQFSNNQAETVVGLVDEEPFEKVINHLLYKSFSQIVKKGKITVRLSRVMDGIEVQVINDGLIIPPSDLEQIFDRFFQPKENDAGVTGSVLGLSVSRELIGMMGGTISVTSDERDGTVFTIIVRPTDEIPIPLSEQPIKEVRISEVNEDLLNIPSNTTVLIVEDNADLRQYLESLLRNHFKLLTAENGQTAMALLESNTPDLILTDVMMPVMNGWELIEAIQKRPAWSQIPIIVLTAVAENQDRLKGLRMGVDDYILKPFETEELLIKISNLVTNLRERIKWAKEFESEENGQDLAEQNELVLAIREYVLEHLEDKSLNVLQLALHLGLSERQLYRKTAESVGLSPSKLIQEVKMQRARELLISRKFNKLSQIAGEVGFDSSSHFSKLYVERFGKKPTDYFS